MGGCIIYLFIADSVSLLSFSLSLSLASSSAVNEAARTAVKRAGDGEKSVSEEKVRKGRGRRRLSQIRDISVRFFGFCWFFFI